MSPITEILIWVGEFGLTSLPDTRQNTLIEIMEFDCMILGDMIGPVKQTKNKMYEISRDRAKYALLIEVSVIETWGGL